METRRGRAGPPAPVTRAGAGIGLAGDAAWYRLVTAGALALSPMSRALPAWWSPLVTDALVFVRPATTVPAPRHRRATAR